MKVRTLRMKEGFKEFAILEGNQLYTSETPTLLNPEATMDDFKTYCKTFHPNMVIDYDRVEIVEFDMIELKIIE